MLNWLVVKDQIAFYRDMLGYMSQQQGMYDYFSVLEFFAILRN